MVWDAAYSDSTWPWLDDVAAIVTADEQTYRIEVLKAYTPSLARYTAYCWVQRTVSVLPAALVLPSKVEHEDVTIWVRHRFSSPVEGRSPKGVLAHAQLPSGATSACTGLTSPPRHANNAEAPVAIFT